MEHWTDLWARTQARRRRFLEVVAAEASTDQKWPRPQPRIGEAEAAAP